MTSLSLSLFVYFNIKSGSLVTFVLLHDLSYDNKKGKIKYISLNVRETKKKRDIY